MATKAKTAKDTEKDSIVEEAVEQLHEAKEQLTEAVNACRKAASEAGATASAEIDELVDKGRNVLCEAQGLIRKHPVAAFGVAFAAGWMLSRLTRR